MSVRNQAWYDLNESRPWPLDDAATRLDDNGTPLPHELLADVYLRFPVLLGDRAFISALTVGSGLVTVTLLGDSGEFVPLAAVSVPKPVTAGRHYQLDGLYPGVGGWIVFGSGINDADQYSWRFSTAAQSLLLAQTARRYRALPVSSVGLLGSNAALTGIIKLSGGNDVTTLVESRVIEGVARDALVIKLSDKLEEPVSRNLLETYAGSCGQRPESGNCGDPQPIEYVNTVAPDCCGRIFIEFRGCGVLQGITDECGVVVNCGVGLSESCVTPDRLPDDQGRLPNEYDDQCVSYDDDETISVTETAAENYVRVIRSAAAGLPYTENFEDLVADDLSVVSGEFVIVVGGNGSGNVQSVTNNGGFAQVRFTTAPVSLPLQFTVAGSSGSSYNVTHTTTATVDSRTVVTDVTYVANATGGTWAEVASGTSGAAGVVYEAQEDRENIVLWNLALPTGWDALYKQAETTITIKIGSLGAKDNGGLLFNYQDSDNFWLAEADWGDGKQFRVLQKVGGLWKIRAAVAVPDLDQNRRYRIVVKVLPMDVSGGSTSALVDATLTGLDDAVEYALNDVVLPGYLPATGVFGLYADRSLTWFEELTVDNYNPA